MAEKETAVKTATKETEKPLKYSVTFPDGVTVNGEIALREFAPNMKNKVKNSGYQQKISSGSYSGSIMIIDYLKQKPL